MIGIVLDERAFFQAGEHLGNRDIFFKHLLLGMERKRHSPFDGKAFYVLLNGDCLPSAHLPFPCKGMTSAFFLPVSSSPLLRAALFTASGARWA